MTALDDFIADARTVTLETVFGLVKGELGRKSGDEYAGPCPACGGRDRFAVNFKKGLWYCRQYDGGRGGDGLALMAHALALDLSRRAGLLLACSEVQDGRAIPEGGERETDAERAARQVRMAELRRAAEAMRAGDEADANAFRDKEIGRARGLWLGAAGGAGTPAEVYLCRRIGAAALPAALWENLRFRPDLTYWEGRDARGHAIDMHCGPGLIAPAVDLSGRITGCHQTWIDLDLGPKFRPRLFTLTDAGRRAGHPALDDAHHLPPAELLAAGHYAPLPTKKMRGHKKGSIIPVLGHLGLARWLVGEGIETVLAVAMAEGWRDDTFYAAAGDIGNMAGPADPKSAFGHPVLKKEDARGRWKPVRVAGPVPKPASAGEAFGVAGHVTELVLLADGDSEFVATASAMARAEARLARAGLALATWWPPEGCDWADMATYSPHPSEPGLSLSHSNRSFLCA